jgi:probable HAF family extracellular repeat protein
MHKSKPRCRSPRSPRPLHLEALEDRFLLSTYTLTDLGRGGANGINDSGLVVIGGERAFTWDSINGRQDLQTFGVDGPSTAIGVSPNGLVVGDAPTSLPGHPDHAFLNDHGVVTDLGTLGGARSAAFGVNDAGQVVGFSNTSGIGYDHAFLWDSQNGMQDLGTLGGLVSSARGINGSGLVVGSSYLQDGRRHAFVWDRQHGMRDITGNELYSDAVGVNDAGQVVGKLTNDAFFYDGATLTDLGNLGGVAVAIGINDAGIIVGGSDTSAVGDEHGFVYADGVMTDLNDLVPPDSGLTIVEAEGINNAGQIVGVAADTAFHPHAILLTPDDTVTARGVVPGIVEVSASVHESTGNVFTTQRPTNVLQERAATTAVASLSADASLRQATGAVFTSRHLLQPPGTWIAGDNGGLAGDWSPPL